MCFSFITIYLLCVSKLFFVSMCVCLSVIVLGLLIKLLLFDLYALSILILVKLCMNLLCLYRSFIKFYFISSKNEMEIK